MVIHKLASKHKLHTYSLQCGDTGIYWGRSLLPSSPPKAIGTQHNTHLMKPKKCINILNPSIPSHFQFASYSVLWSHEITSDLLIQVSLGQTYWANVCCSYCFVTLLFTKSSAGELRREEVKNNVTLGGFWGRWQSRRILNSPHPMDTPR